MDKTVERKRLSKILEIPVTNMRADIPRGAPETSQAKCQQMQSKGGLGSYLHE